MASNKFRSGNKIPGKLSFVPLQDYAAHRSPAVQWEASSESTCVCVHLCVCLHVQTLGQRELFQREHNIEIVIGEFKVTLSQSRLTIRRQFCPLEITTFWNIPANFMPSKLPSAWTDWQCSGGRGTQKEPQILLPGL